MFTDDTILHVEKLKDLQKSKAIPPFLLICFALKKLPGAPWHQAEPVGSPITFLPFLETKITN